MKQLSLDLKPDLADSKSYGILIMVVKIKNSNNKLH